jgi:hypothetical protein
MKVIFNNHPSIFEIYLEAETADDQLNLVQFGLNAIKEPLSFKTFARRDSITATILIGQRKIKNVEIEP